VTVHTERLGGLRDRLTSLSPKDTLRRGYAIVHQAADGKIVIDADQVAPGDQVGVTLGGGGFEAEVTAVSAAPSRD
jgi:exodeoxyribonuclease VII large subunit